MAVARQFGGGKRNFNGEKCWAHGYAVSTVGFEEEQVRKYIRLRSSWIQKGMTEKRKKRMYHRTPFII